MNACTGFSVHNASIGAPAPTPRFAVAMGHATAGATTPAAAHVRKATRTLPATWVVVSPEWAWMRQVVSASIALLDSTKTKLPTTRVSIVLLVRSNAAPCFVPRGEALPFMYSMAPRNA